MLKQMRQDKRRVNVGGIGVKADEARQGESQCGRG